MSKHKRVSKFGYWFYTQFGSTPGGWMSLAQLRERARTTATTADDAENLARMREEYEREKRAARRAWSAARKESRGR